MSFVIGVSGKINSGKTTISQFLSNDLQFTYVSFGNYVRKQAELYKLSKDRKTLQDLGQSYFENDVEEFCKNVLYSDNWNGKSNLVVDGIRHVDVYNKIKILVSPLPVYLIYILADERTRKERTKTVNIANIDNHPSEYDVTFNLLDRADLIIDGADEFNQNKIKIINWIRSLK